MPYVNTHNMGCAVVQQAICETTCGLAQIHAVFAHYIEPKTPQSALELEASTRDVTQFSDSFRTIQFERSLRRQLVGIFRNGLPTGAALPAHTGSDQTLRLHARGGQAALYQQLVCPHGAEKPERAAARRAWQRGRVFQ